MNLKEKYNCKIISMLGSPATGKTYLAKILAKELDAEIIYEHPENGFPIEIQENLKKQENLLDTIIWFRNHQINNYQKALELSKKKTVILDTPFYQNQLYIELYIKNNFQKKILYELGNKDFELFRQPDTTIYLSTTTKTMEDFLNRRKGERHWENENCFKFITQMPPFVEQFVQQNKNNIANLIKLDRLEYNFQRKADINKLYKILLKVKF